MTQQNFSTPYDVQNEPLLHDRLKKNGFEFSSINYGFWKAQRAGMTVIFYKSGKLLIQGPGAANFAAEFLQASKKVAGLDHVTGYNAWIGSDEAGKGDFFGPLVVGAVCVNKKDLQELLLMQVQDSKKMTDAKIARIAKQVMQKFPYAITLIKPEQYNVEYQKHKNLNTFLAWAHADAVSELGARTGCETVLTDKFANDAVLRKEFQKRKKRFQLVQMERAEINPAVAAAAIVARHHFVEYLSKMSHDFGIDFPKGASASVIDSGRTFLTRYGRNQLNKVAKLHFKTVHKL